MKTKIPFNNMLDIRRRLAAGAAPASLLKEVEAFGYDMHDLTTLQADVEREGPAGIRFGCGTIEIKTR